jgi:hypothetical protein
MPEGERFELIITYKRGSVGIPARVFIYYNKFKPLDHTPWLRGSGKIRVCRFSSAKKLSKTSETNSFF